MTIISQPISQRSVKILAFVTALSLCLTSLSTVHAASKSQPPVTTEQAIKLVEQRFNGRVISLQQPVAGSYRIKLITHRAAVITIECNILSGEMKLVELPTESTPLIQPSN